MPPEHHLAQALTLLQHSRQRIAIYLSQKNRLPTAEEIQQMHMLHDEYRKAGHYAEKAVRVMYVTEQRKT